MFKQGDKVRKKTGGVVMTVKTVENGQVSCVFDERKVGDRQFTPRIKEGLSIPEDQLELAEPGE